MPEMSRTKIAAVATAAAFVGLAVLLYRRRKAVPRKKFLDRTRKPMVLQRIDQISADTRRYVFALEHPDQPLGLPTGQHIKLFAPNSSNPDCTWNGQEDPDCSKGKPRAEIERKYTPTSRVTDQGQLELVVKVYRAGCPAKFPDGGKMSQYLDSLSLKDSIDVQGPYGSITYKGKGVWKFGYKESRVRKIGMLAGGTGITPMLQIMQSIAADPEDSTEGSLLFGNQTPADILCLEELTALASRFRLWYTVDRVPQGQEWPPKAQRGQPASLSDGFISKEKIQKLLPGPGEDTAVLLCGPPGMVKHLSEVVLAELGYKKDQIHVF